MAKRSGSETFVLHILILLIIACSCALSIRNFNVKDYGAIADGKTDNAQAFLRTWKDACHFPGRSRFWIPPGMYMLGSVSFEGLCLGPMVFTIEGTLLAPTDPRNFFGDTWIAFRRVNSLTVEGGGTLDGQGHAAWQYNDCRTNQNCRTLPATMRLDFVKYSRIQNIHSTNSKNTHFNLFACHELSIDNVTITAPRNSPNTDGIHIGGSTNIHISHVDIGTGDDCIALVSGSQDIDINNVACGPGHGISIGSLGRSANEFVSGISVSHCNFTDTDNGVRIKTWAPSLPSIAWGLKFEDIFMQNVRNPVFIDQQYCPSGGCGSQVSSGVQIKDVTFKNIRGTSRTETAVNLQCSRDVPCKDIKLIDIQLVYNGHQHRHEHGHRHRHVQRSRLATSVCSNVMGSFVALNIPTGCEHLYQP